ncbi:hypothetical protein PIB30_060703 [Stylosanthes scabra]|uniref:Putative plant transposon protein domain-containing protein n=1 Tax=Stylosanthes scabra TaxID=79078 RepID=A0ABU6UP91_9FABA|nr:hypothetical protein [Stylosanthes scabra]
MIREFFANACRSEDEMDGQQLHPYTGHVRGVEIDFSLATIKRVMRFKEDTPRAENNYGYRQKYDPQLDTIIRDLCIEGATWKMSKGRNPRPVQLRRPDLFPVARGWQEFTINNIIPSGNKSEITIGRAVLIHCIMKGEDVRAEELIADNIAIIAQGLGGNCQLGFPSTIYKLCKEAGVRMREFKNMEEVDMGRYITKEVMEKFKIPRIFLPIMDNNEGNDEPMPQYVPPFIPEAENADVDNQDQDQEQHQHFEHHFEPPPHFEQQPQNFQQQQPQYVTYADFQQFQQNQIEQMQQYQQNQMEQKQQYQQNQMDLQQQGFQKLTDQIGNMQIGIQNELGNYKKEVQGLKEKQEELYNHYNNLYNYMKEKQKFLAKELDEIKRFQVGQTMMASRTDAIEKLNFTMEELRNKMTMIKRQLKEWTKNASHKDAYCYWAHQQSNPNLTEIPTYRIPKIMQENAEKGRSIFYGFLKSDPEVGSSSAPTPGPNQAQGQQDHH